MNAADSTAWENATSLVSMTRFAFNGRFVLSHRSIVHAFTALDPVRSLSVYEPGARGGCAGGDHRAFTSASAQGYGCIFATNAGYFNTTTGECHGNVISDGRVVQVHDLQQPCFGIRADGSIAVGYLPVEEVGRAGNPYVQMVCGVVWLVRDGESFVASSLGIEADYAPIQETGTPHVFSTTITGRTIIGHDARGVVKILQFDGISYYTGFVLMLHSVCRLYTHWPRQPGFDDSCRCPHPRTQLCQRNQPRRRRIEHGCG